MTRLPRTASITGVGLATLIAALVPTSASAHRKPVLPSTIVVSAHRGGSAYAPENTMYAFHNAVRIGADQMETDSSLTADGVLVLIHDSTLDRTTNCTGSVSNYTFAQLQKCDAGWWWTPGQSTTSPDATAPHPLRGLGITVPAATELFNYIRHRGRSRKHTINIEIKDPNFAGSARALVSIIEASGLKSRTIVQSFYPPALDYVKTLDSTISTALLTAGATSAYVAYSLPNNHPWISPSNADPDLSGTTVSAAHALGKKVIPWTPDRRSDLTTTGLKGVDGLITNYPACLLELEGRRHPRRLLPKASIAAGSGPVSPCRDEPPSEPRPKHPRQIALDFDSRANALAARPCPRRGRGRGAGRSSAAGHRSCRLCRRRGA